VVATQLSCTMVICALSARLRIPNWETTQCKLVPVKEPDRSI
jgi:hypothetical protein